MKITDNHVDYFIKEMKIHMPHLKNKNNKFKKQLKKGMQVELEHGTVSPLTNVTDNDVIFTGKIAMAHINEFPDYYERLSKLEREGDEYWKNRDKNSYWDQDKQNGGSKFSLKIN